jgi:hypothetical protein
MAELATYPAIDADAVQLVSSRALLRISLPKNLDPLTCIKQDQQWPMQE